jgi:hypothetical protein
VPVSIHRVVARGLERDRAKRFPSMAALLAELAPAPVRSRLTLFALGGAALLVGGIGVAAAVRDPNGSPVIHDDQWALEKLHKLELTVTRLDAERKALIDELEHRPTPEDIAKLREELKAKDAQIDDLVGQVQQLTREIKPGVAKAPPPPPTQSAQVVAALDQSRGNVKGCFVEWGEQPKDPPGTGRNGDSPAKLVVSVSVCANGTAHRQLARGIDSPTLTGCTADAIARVAYPPGDEDLELEIGATWDVNGLTLAPRVVGHHDARATCDVD